MSGFKDKYGRPIDETSIGAFIANGHRAGGSGGISVGIITKVGEKSIQADTILEGHLSKPEGGYETVFYWGKTNFYNPRNCYVIRGITLEQFTDGLEVLSAEEYKTLRAEEMAAWRQRNGH